MTPPHEDLIAGYLDEWLGLEQEQLLELWIRESPEHAKQFAEAVLLHDRIRSEMLAMSVMGEVEEQKPQPLLAAWRRRSWRQRAVALMALACLFAFAVWMGWRNTELPTLAASDELARVIRASELATDRTYLITALASEYDLRAAPGPRGDEQPPVDGALLHVRGSNQYVLIRFERNGEKFITGSNGQIAWAVPPRGRVRVSQDPTRFRGAVPGQQHAIPFIDMRGSLELLQQSYELILSSREPSGNSRCMIATRKEPASGGPKQVSLWYDSQTGVIHRMLLDRLPQARGGPRSVLLELVDQVDLGPTFFEPESHHDASRDVVEE